MLVSIIVKRPISARKSSIAIGYKRYFLLLIILFILTKLILYLFIFICVYYLNYIYYLKLAQACLKSSLNLVETGGNFL
jgi:hypothetical protein